MNKFLPVALVLVALLLSIPYTPTKAQTRAQPIAFNSIAELEAAQEPKSANPYVAFLPAGVEPDYGYWQQWMQLKGAERARGLRASPQTINYTEMEPTNATGNNDSLASAEHIAGFGTDSNEDFSADITGILSGIQVTVNNAGPFAEDDGSINVANPLALSTNSFIRVDGTIGDGPHGSSGTGTGDFDFFRLSGLTQGEVIEIQVATASPLDDLDPNIAIWDANGRILGFNEDISGTNFDSFLRYVVPTSGTFFLSIHGFRSTNAIANLPTNPFDAASGQGAGSEGAYALFITKDAGDRDFYSFDLEIGDIIGANLSTASQSTFIQLIDPSGNLLMSTELDGSSGYGAGSPLPGGGPSLAHVVPAAGRYFMQVIGSPNAAYTLQLRAFRPSLESDVAGSKQIIFLDFDGATINADAIFDQGNTNATLTPFANFLGNWGLAGADESAVIDAILETVVEGLDTDIATNGSNAKFDIEIRNSRDHADPFGQPNVSRMIIGGTQEELGIETIGIADSIDVGNFAHEETAVVLLDILSAQAGTNGNSLNNFNRSPSASMIDIIGVGVGNIINHEAGHYFGNWHTDQFNSTANLMDQGGNLPLSILGIGPDNVFGTADDIDPDHVTDVYNPFELYRGNEDTLTSIAYGLTTPGVPTAVTVQTQAQSTQSPVILIAILLAAALGTLTVGWIRPK